MVPARHRREPGALDPLVSYLIDTLVATGVEILHVEPAPDGSFRLSWEDKLCRRAGIAGLLLPLRAGGQDPAGATATVVMPGVPDGACPCDIDPFGLFTPVLLGVDPARALFVAFDPTRHFPEDDPLATAEAIRPGVRCAGPGGRPW